MLVKLTQTWSPIWCYVYRTPWPRGAIAAAVAGQCLSTVSTLQSTCRGAFSKQSHFPVYSSLTSASHTHDQSRAWDTDNLRKWLCSSLRRPRGPLSYPVPCLPLSELDSLAHFVCQFVKHDGLYVIRLLLLLRPLPSLNKRIVYDAISVVGPIWNFDLNYMYAAGKVNCLLCKHE